MKLTLKLRTWMLVGGVTLALMAIGSYFFMAHLSREKSDALVKQILDARPLSDDLVYVSARGYGYTDTALNRHPSPETVITYVQQMMKEYPNHIWTQNNSMYTLAQLYRKAGRWEEALQLFKKVAASDSSHSAQAEEWVRILDQPDDGMMPSIIGKVWLGDRAADHVYVYLIDKDSNSWYSNPVGNYNMTITNEQGEYRFYNVDPGAYFVGVGIEPERVEGYVLTEDPEPYVTVVDEKTTAFDIHFKEQMIVVSPANGEVIRGDTIQFRWEPYPGAVSYKISIEDVALTEEGKITPLSGGLLQLSEEWKEPQAEYTIDELRQKYTGLVTSYNEQGLTPDSVLGLVYPGGHFTWSVDAYNQSGFKINSSRGVFATSNSAVPLFSLDGEGQLQGDLYVLNQDYEQAVAKYQEEMTNPYALRALALMVLNGNGRDEQGNLAEALRYLEMIEKPTQWDLELIERIEERLARSRRNI